LKPPAIGLAAAECDLPTGREFGRLDLALHPLQELPRLLHPAEYNALQCANSGDYSTL
jgi:hypothetical protein